jgi:hypothetical protein
MRLILEARATELWITARPRGVSTHISAHRGRDAAVASAHAGPCNTLSSAYAAVDRGNLGCNRRGPVSPLPLSPKAATSRATASADATKLNRRFIIPLPLSRDKRIDVERAAPVSGHNSR